MPIEQGIDLLLKRILKEPTENPPQFEKRPVQLRTISDGFRRQRPIRTISQGFKRPPVSPPPPVGTLDVRQRGGLERMVSSFPPFRGLPTGFQGEEQPEAEEVDQDKQIRQRRALEAQLAGELPELPESEASKRWQEIREKVTTLGQRLAGPIPEMAKAIKGTRWRDLLEIYEKYDKPIEGTVNLLGEEIPKQELLDAFFLATAMTGGAGGAPKVPRVPKGKVPKVKPIPEKVTPAPEVKPITEEIWNKMSDEAKRKAALAVGIETRPRVGWLGLTENEQFRLSRGRPTVEKPIPKLAIPKAEAVKYPATPAGAEARAKAEGIPISEASRLNAEEALKAPATRPEPVERVAKVPPTKPPAPMGRQAGVTPLPSTTVKAEQAIGKIINVLKTRKAVLPKIEIEKAASIKRVAQNIDDLDFVTTTRFARQASSAMKGKRFAEPVFEKITKKMLPEENMDLVLKNAFDSGKFDGAFEKARLARLLSMRGPVRTGERLVESDIELLEKLLPGVRDAFERPGMGKIILRNLVDLLNLPRVPLTILDYSYGLRQTILLGVTRPLTWGKRFVNQFPASFSEKYFQNKMTQIKAHPFYKDGLDDGLEFLESATPGRLALSLEAFMSSIWRRIPGLKQAVRHAERAALTMSNGLRWDVYYQLKNSYGTAIPKGKWKQIAGALNIGTGRGYLGRRLNAIAPVLNTVLFSSRFQASIIESPLLLGSGSRVVRGLAWRSLLTQVGAFGSLLGLGKLTGLWDIELNPHSTDSGKLRIGNVRIDVSPHLQWIRLIARLVTGQTKTELGTIEDIDRLNTLLRFGRGKLAPLLSFVTDLLDGKTFLGEDLPSTWKDMPNEIKERFAPMVIGDLLDAYGEDGLKGLAVASGAIWGANVSAYSSRAFHNWAVHLEDKLGKEWTRPDLMRMRTIFEKNMGTWDEYIALSSDFDRDMYLAKNPQIEASLYFWGVRKRLQTTQARDEFFQKVTESNLSVGLWPIREVEESYNPGMFESRATRLDALDKVVPSYMRDYIRDNREQLLNQDLIDVVRRWEVARKDDEKRISIYNLTMMGMDTGTRKNFRKKNPDIDATLNFWGHVTITLSKEADEILITKALLLGVPPNIIPALGAKPTKPSFGIGTTGKGKTRFGGFKVKKPGLKLK